MKQNFTSIALLKNQVERKTEDKENVSGQLAQLIPSIKLRLRPPDSSALRRGMWATVTSLSCLQVLASDWLLWINAPICVATCKH
ncbi:hypothetical protein EYF80_025697 [Liparis tanakae]|uniref:Uncharacterized protein n=1 Tax=Liparis tanakae TaxID=230148 RepID=A0A4Z2HE04_9TELE|nr:hypothetical protein EYF80_025697 [Liparis tanakae]